MLHGFSEISLTFFVEYINVWHSDSILERFFLKKRPQRKS